MRLLWLFGAAVVAGAPAIITVNMVEATPQPTPVSHCTTSVVNPAPTQAVCGATGTISNVDLLFRYRILVNELNLPDLCGSYCLTVDYGCQSFSYDSDVRLCTLYFGTLAEQQFIPGPTSPDSNATYYDTSCFASNCPIRSPGPNPTVSHISSCSAIYQATHPASANCNTGYIQSLQNPDPIGTAPVRRCSLDCLNNPDCQSLMYNNTVLSCTLFGETIEQQGPIASNSNPDASYLDKACYEKSCIPCDPPTPTTTYSSVSPGQTCIPSVTTQLAQNPSFEDSSDGSPWILGDGVTLVTSDSTNAYQGSNYIKMVRTQSSLTPSVNQTITGLQTGSKYRVQYALRHAQLDDPTRCNLNILADGKNVGQSSTLLHLPDTIDNSTIYRLNYASFTASSSATTISLQYSCYAYQAPDTLYIDAVDIIPAGPVCSFKLQLADNSPKFNGLYVGSGTYSEYFGRDLTLVNDASSAAAFGLDGFGFLVNTDVNDTYLSQPYPTAHAMPYATLNNFGTLGQILCQVADDQSLQCINIVRNANAFRWCSQCQLGELEFAWNFVAKSNPYYNVCELLDLRALFD